MDPYAALAVMISSSMHGQASLPIDPAFPDMPDVQSLSDTVSARSGWFSHAQGLINHVLFCKDEHEIRWWAQWVAQKSQGNSPWCKAGKDIAQSFLQADYSEARRLATGLFRGRWPEQAPRRMILLHPERDGDYRVEAAEDYVPKSKSQPPSAPPSAPASAPATPPQPDEDWEDESEWH